jgi:hypothetical protein
MPSLGDFSQPAGWALNIGHFRPPLGQLLTERAENPHETGAKITRVRLGFHFYRFLLEK